MHHRLQDLRAFTQEQRAQTIDLQVWAKATSLQFCGVELHLSQGRATVGLVHLHADGHEEEIAELSCLHPGSAFSPPLEVEALVQTGGRLRAELRMTSPDAVLDLYLGSNDRPPLPQARVIVITRARNAAEAQTAIESFATFQQRYGVLYADQDCHLLLDLPAAASADLAPILKTAPTAKDNVHLRTGGRIWLRRAVHEVTFGDLSDRGLTHLVLQPEGQPLQPEGFVHALAQARFMRDGILWHNRPQDSTRWPHICLDLMQVMRHGLPCTRADAYAQALDGKGVQRCSFTPPAQVPAPGPRRTLYNQIARMLVPTPSPKIIRMRQDFTQQMRRLHKEQGKSIRQLEAQLQSNQLWDPAIVRHDQERSSRTLLSLLRNRHLGQRAVVVGNGPSLRTRDLDRLQQTVTFGSNKIWLAYDRTNWRPTYYSVEDHLVLQNNRDHIEALSGSLKIFPANMRGFGYHSGDTIFAPFLPPKSFEDPLSDPEFPAFSHDLSHGIAWGSTIVYSQIQMALYMGCREIILIGLDHRYELPKEKHGNRYVDAGERNHFHPGYRAPGEVWHQPNLDVLEVSYAKARKICDASGVALRNASRETSLDVIERADFDQLFPPEETSA